MKPRTDGEARGLTPFGRALATAGAALLLLGLGFGDYPYLICALFCLGLALYARGHQAKGLAGARRLSKEDVHAGESLAVVTEARADGVISAHDIVPDAFALESGSNFAVGVGAASLRYSLKSPRRGELPIGPLRVTSYDPLFLQSALVETVGEPDRVTVHPNAPPATRIRTSAAWGRTMLPGGDRASRGIRTNDFRELRPYARGDPLRSVNWKATARQSRDELNLIVNDYEVEGKKVVWIFVDASPYTIGGTTLTSVFDELAQGALTVAGHYLDMGHRVGCTVFGSGATRILYAEAGDLQERRLAAALAEARPGEPGETLGSAVESTKGFLAREKPLLFIFTLPGRDPALADALRSARALASTGRRPAPVIAVTPITETASDLASRVVAIRERAQMKGLERRGVTVVRYHPTKMPLSALLARGVLR